MKPLPIGISDFKKIIEEGYAYVDKTLFIKELIDGGYEAVLIPRPRRFGKTLALSMLRTFFEKGEKDTSHLFTHLKIWEDEKCRSLQGQFPVIFLSFKDVDCTSFKETLDAFRFLIAEECARYRVVLLESTLLSEEEKQWFKELLSAKAGTVLLQRSLKFLMNWLSRVYKKNVILLVDEYDAPVHASWTHGYYDKLISFLRTFLSNGFKDNNYLKLGVITGILRISKESIFSKLNNVKTYTVLDDEFQSHFGLLEEDVEMLFKEADVPCNRSEVKSWYNGYSMGSLSGFYNPWSILNCIANNGVLEPYWVNTSSNDLIRDLIKESEAEFKEDVKVLLEQGSIQKNIDEAVPFKELVGNSDAIWSLLLYTGYLTLDKPAPYGESASLRIPNKEIERLYHSVIKKWFQSIPSKASYPRLLNSLKTGDITFFSKLFQEFMLHSASFFDISGEEPERVYHAFVLGMLVGLKEEYEVKSNRESGYGRYDVMLIPKDKDKLGIIMEFKKVDPSDHLDLENAADSAIAQIEEKAYASELLARGVTKVLFIGLAFQKKEVVIRSKSMI